MIAPLALVLAIAAPGERVVLHTTAGDLVVSLAEREAPHSAAQFKRLVQSGIYDGVKIYRVMPGFIAQVANAEDRDRPLDEAQRRLLTRIPLEAGLPHLRGSLSFAHADGDPDGAISSFSILFGAAPHLDGKYTVFGSVEAGDAVLDELASVATNSQHQPLSHLEIESAELVAGPIEAAARNRGRRQVTAAAGPGDAGAAVSLLAAIMLFGIVAMALLSSRLPRRAHRSAGLLVALLGGFGLLLVLLPLAPRNGALGCGLFTGLIALFAAMGRFELREPGQDIASAIGPRNCPLQARGP